MVNKYCKVGRVKKIMQKIQSETEHRLDLQDIPRVTGSCYHDMITEDELFDIEFLINEKLLKLSKIKYPNIRLTDVEREFVALENRLKQLLKKVREM